MVEITLAFGRRISDPAETEFGHPAGRRCCWPPCGAVSMSSISSSAASGSLKPPRAKNLIPLSGAGLWLAESMTPSSAPSVAGQERDRRGRVSRRAAARQRRTRPGQRPRQPRGTHPTPSGRGRPRPRPPASLLGLGERACVTSTATVATARSMASWAVRSRLPHHGHHRYRKDGPWERPRIRARFLLGISQPLPPSGQRFEYCGAFLAFFRPYFFRSFTLASRVRKQALFRVGLFSGSTIFSARAIPSRSAPACPVTPPPVIRATTSNCVVRPETHERLADELLVHLVREELVQRPVVDPPLPAAREMRTRAIASLRRPVPSALPVTTGLRADLAALRRLAGLRRVLRHVLRGGFRRFHASVLSERLRASGLGHGFFLVLPPRLHRCAGRLWCPSECH